MKELIETIKNKKFLFNLILSISLALAILCMPIIGSQARLFSIEQSQVMYQTTASKLMLNRADLSDNTIFRNDSNGFYSANFYVANLIENLQIEFYNTISISKESTLSYTATVFGALIVETDEGQILQETKTISSDRDTKEVPSSLNLNKFVTVNYGEYIDRFTVINNTLSGVSCFGTIKITYKISANGVINGEDYSYSDTMTAYIPIKTTGLVSITNEYQTSTKINKSEDELVNKVNYFVFALGIFFALTGACGFALLVFAWVSEFKEDAQKRYIHKLLSDYNDIIVSTDTVDNLPKKEMLVLESFDDMVKVETELSTPIIFVKKDTLYKFYVFGKNITYYYEINEILPEEDTLKEQE